MAKNLSYLIDLTYDKAYKGYVADVVNLYGCMSQGKTKEEALKQGHGWSDEENPSPPATMLASALPDTIKETDESILNEIIECTSCKRSYRIVKGEFDLLRKLSLPVPRECPKCRENNRFARMTKPGLYHRNCAKCGNPIYTPYPPEDGRIIYCVKDYQAEFL